MSLLKPGLIAASTTQVNNSTAKQMYSFGKASRFVPIRKPL